MGMRHFLSLLESDRSDGISLIGPEDQKEALAFVDMAFGPHMPDASQYADAVTDWTASYKIVQDGEIVGVYLLAPGDVTAFTRWAKEDLSRYQGKRGVEGVALIVKPEFRGTGLGKQLIELPKTLGYDYIFGQHLKSLQNLDHWLKRRRLVADTGAVWVTLADLKQPLKESEEAPSTLAELLKHVEDKIVSREVPGEYDRDLDRIKELVQALRNEPNPLTYGVLLKRLRVIEEELTDFLIDRTEEVFEEEPEIDDARFEVQEFIQRFERGGRRNRG